MESSSDELWKEASHNREMGEKKNKKRQGLVNHEMNGMKRKVLISMKKRYEHA